MSNVDEKNASSSTPTAEELQRPWLAFHMPLGDSCKKIHEKLRQDAAFCVEEFSSAPELSTMLSSVPLAVIIFHLYKIDQVVKHVTVLKSFAEAIRAGRVKPLLLHGNFHDDIMNVYAKYGCQDFLKEPVTYKSISFKFKTMLATVESKMNFKVEEEMEYKFSTSDEKSGSSDWTQLKTQPAQSGDIEGLRQGSIDKAIKIPEESSDLKQRASDGNDQTSSEVPKLFEGDPKALVALGFVLSELMRLPNLEVKDICDRIFSLVDKEMQGKRVEFWIKKAIGEKWFPVGSSDQKECESYFAMEHLDQPIQIFEDNTLVSKIELDSNHAEGAIVIRGHRLNEIPEQFVSDFTRLFRGLFLSLLPKANTEAKDGTHESTAA